MISYVDHSGELHDVLGKKGFSFSYIESEDPDDCKCKDGLVFLHTDYSKKWIEYAKKNVNMHFIFISREAPNSLPNTIDLPDNAHLCHIPALALKTNLRFSEFLDELKTKKMRWDLLLLPPNPEHLVAAYVVGITIQKGVVLDNSELPTGLWEKVTEEYVRLSGEHDVNLTMDNIKDYLPQVETALRKQIRTGLTC